MDQNDVVALYRSTGALKEGHFRLSSGLHSDRYFQSALVLANPRSAEQLGAALAAKYADTAVDLVVGPAMGAIVIAHEVARGLGVPSYFAERVEDRFTLRRGFAIEPGQRVLLVEDVLTTGGSILELRGVVEALGARVVGMGCLVDRREADKVTSTEFRCLARLEVKTWQPAACPLCQAGQPLDAPGSRERA